MTSASAPRSSYQQLEALNRIVHYQCNDRGIRDATELDAAVLESARMQGLNVSPTLVTFTCMYVLRELRPPAKRRRQPR